MPLELNNLTIGTDARDGQGGDIEIKAPSLTITNSKISTSTKTYGTGNAGDINIITPESVLLTNSQINTDNKGSGFAGNIQINDSKEVSLLNGSKISSQGNDGNIDITTNTLSLNQKSEINTNSEGSEKAGSIKINNSKKVSILNGSEISSQGNNGNIDITTGTLSLNQKSE
jgi:large exoprotein involved in heme utilization and adhesion